MNLLNIGKQGLIANQNALATTGQNISNVNTDGYTRQRVNFDSLPAYGGVEVTSVERLADDLLTKQLWSDLSSYNQSSTFSSLTAQLDDLLAQQTTSVSDAMDKYFSSLQNVVDDPVSNPNRELFIAETEALVQRFNNLDANLRIQEANVNTLIDDYTSQVSTLGSNIADLNDKINLAVAANKPSNELEDQRDQLVNELSDLVSINVLEEGNKSYSIFLANGQPLVVGPSSNQMISTPSDSIPNERSVKLVIAGNTTEVTDQLSGGKLGGVLRYRDESLNDARDELGRIAIALSETMNQQHRSGIDVNNNYGGDIFSDVNSSAAQASRLQSHVANRSDLSSSAVSIENVDLLQASGYELTYGGENQITLTREEDGKVFDIDRLTPSTADRTVEANSVGTVAALTSGATAVTAPTENLTVTLNGVATAFAGVDSAKGVADALNGTAGVSGVSATSAVGITDITEAGANGAQYTVEVLDNTGTARTMTITLPTGGTAAVNSKAALDVALAGLETAGHDMSNISIAMDGTDVKITDSTGGNIAVEFTDNTDADVMTVKQYTNDTTQGAGAALTANAPAQVKAIASGYLDDSTATIDGTVTSLSIASSGTGLIGGASVNMIDATNNVASTVGNVAQGVADVSEGEYYLDPNKGTLSFAVDGIKVTLKVDGTFVDGDRYSINAVRTGAEDLKKVIQDGNQLALASPVRVSPADSNQGTGVATVDITDTSATTFAVDGQLQPPVEIVFDNADPIRYTVYDMSESTNPVPLDTGNGPLVNQAFTPGQVVSLNGYDITIANQPSSGDRFSFEFNKDGISDNRNALKISNLQNTKVVGGSDYQDLYGSLIEKVGTTTATSKIATDASKAVMDTTANTKASVSGVNLDEEAARLVQFQQAYQATAQLIRVSQSIFDSLLQAV